MRICLCLLLWVSPCLAQEGFRSLISTDSIGPPTSVRLSWPAIPGREYYVLTADDPGNSSWHACNLSPLVASQDLITYETTPNLSAQYFRILQMENAADAYANVVGMSNQLHSQRFSQFINLLHQTGLWSNLVDGLLLSTNYNLSGNNQPRTLRLNTATNVNVQVWDDAGVQFSETADNRVIMPVNFSGPNTIVVRASSTPTHEAWRMPAALYSGSIQEGGGVHGVNAYATWRHYLRQGTNLFENTYIRTENNDFIWYNDPRWRICSFATDNAGYLGTTVDGYLGAFTSHCPVTLSSNFNRLVLGQMWTGPHETYGSNFVGRVDLALVFNRVLTLQEIRTVEYALRWLDTKPENWVFLGDSLSVWLYHQPTNCWPLLLCSTPDFRNQAAWWTFGRSGHGVVTFANEDYWSNRARLHAPKPDGPATKGLAFVWLGINDILLGGRTATTTFTGLTNVWRLARQDGFEVVALTLPPTGTNPQTGTNWLTNTMEGHRQDLNHLIVTTPHLYDYLVRLDQVFTNMEPTGPDSSDGLHLAYPGNLKVVDACLQTLAGRPRTNPGDP